jgi:hypothetical protein
MNKNIKGKASLGIKKVAKATSCSAPKANKPSKTSSKKVANKVVAQAKENIINAVQAVETKGEGIMQKIARIFGIGGTQSKGQREEVKSTSPSKATSRKIVKKSPAKKKLVAKKSNTVETQKNKSAVTQSKILKTKSASKNLSRPSKVAVIKAKPDVTRSNNVAKEVVRAKTPSRKTVSGGNLKVGMARKGLDKKNGARRFGS